MIDYEKMLKDFKKLIPLAQIETASDNRPELSGQVSFDSESLEIFLAIVHTTNVIISEQNKKYINKYKKRIEQFIKDGTPVSDAEYIRFISNMQTYAYSCGQYNGAINALNTLYKSFMDVAEKNKVDIQ